ncbi:MAG: DUF2062 domain-containing protein [Myxococcota bacterium]
MSKPPARASRWLAVRRHLRRAYVRVMRAPGDPREVALGMAIGLFMSLIPVAQTLLALGAVGVLRRVTRLRVSFIAAAIGTWFTNPFTFAPVYALSSLVGRPIARLLLDVTGARGLLEMTGGWLARPVVIESALGVLVGAVVIGLPLAGAGYELTRRLVLRYQQRRIARQRARALRAIGAEDLVGGTPEPVRAASGS